MEHLVILILIAVILAGAFFVGRFFWKMTFRG